MPTSPVGAGSVREALPSRTVTLACFARLMEDSQRRDSRSLECVFARQTDSIRNKGIILNKRIEPPKRQHNIRVTVTCAFAGALLMGPLSWAEERDTSGYLEEIIVTGTKRATSQQDTPLAVSTLTARDISNTFVNDVRAVADLSPNVLLTKQPGFNALSGGIRGTGSTSILVLQDTSVGIIVDEFVISSVQSQFVDRCTTRCRRRCRSAYRWSPWCRDRLRLFRWPPGPEPRARCRESAQGPSRW